MATPRSGGSLIDHNDWVINPRGETLFGAASAACEPETSFRAEELGGEFVFAIETMDCSTLSVEQGSRLAIRSGDVIKLRFFHANLTAPTGAVARIAVAVGEKIIWSIEVPIPSSWAFLTETIPIDFDAPADTPISFHVANHGANEYALIALTLQN
jgi:hypothetical protein